MARNGEHRRPEAAERPAFVLVGRVLSDLRHRAVYAVLRLGIALLRLLPIERAAALLAAVTGRIGPRLRQHRRAMENLAIAFPDKSAADREAIARAMWRHMGRVLAEMLNIDRLAQDPARVELVEAARWKTELAKPGAQVGITAHIGNWELLVMPLGPFLRHVAGVYRPISNPYLDRYLRNQRSRLYPGGLLAKGQDSEDGGGARTGRVIVDHARKGYMVAFVADHFDRRGVDVPFLGRVTRATPAPAMIARHVKARVFLGRCLRVADTSRFQLHITEIEPPSTGSKAGDDAALTALIFAEFERWIRETPEQWMWWNTRWVEPRPPALTGPSISSARLTIAADASSRE